MLRLLTIMEKEGPQRRLYNLTNSLKTTHKHINKNSRFAEKREALRLALDGLETLTLEMFK